MNDIVSGPTPTPAAIDQRFFELARTGDEQLRAELIEEHVVLAHYFARRYRGRGVPAEDLEQVAVLGLIGAVDRFDPTFGVQFATFAGRTVLGELRRYFRDRTWSVRVPRRYQQLASDVRSAVESLTHSLGRPPTMEQVAESLGVDIEDALVALDVNESYRAESLDKLRGERSGAINDSLVTFDQTFGAVDVDVVYRALLDTLPEREREIVTLRVESGLSQKEIGERLGISQMHVSRLLRRSVGEFRQAMDS